MFKVAIEDIQNKLREERENHDTLLKGKIEITEQLSRLTEEFKKDTETVEDQDALLADLKA